MNDNCRLPNDLSETKTNTYLDQSSICQNCTYLYRKTKAKDFYNLSVALSHARTTVISTFYTSLNQSQRCSWYFRAAILLDVRFVEDWSFCCMCNCAYPHTTVLETRWSMLKCTFFSVNCTLVVSGETNMLLLTSWLHYFQPRFPRQNIDSRSLKQ